MGRRKTKREEEKPGEERRGAPYLLQATVHFWTLLFQVLGIVLYFVGLNWFSVW